MKKEEARLLLEDVLDTLVEVGNGVTDKDLHEAADKLFKFRDEYFNKAEDEIRSRLMGIIQKAIKHEDIICDLLKEIEIKEGLDET